MISFISVFRHVKSLTKRFFFALPLPTQRCGFERIPATIRDERPHQVEQSPIIHTSNTSESIRFRIYTSDIFTEEHYPGNKEVVWQIYNPTDKLVHIHFSEFDLDKNSECGDYVSIHNSHGKIFKLCGSNTSYKNSTIQLLGTKITIKLVTSNLAGTGTGFSADVIIV